MIPQLLLGESHNILLSDGGNSSLNLLWAHAAAGGNDLASNVLGDGSSAIKGKEDGGLKLGLCALNLGFGNVVGEAGPLTESEVDKIIKTSELITDKVDTPKTTIISVEFTYIEVS